MSWTDDQPDRLRDKLVLARRAGEWLTAAEVGIVLGLMAWWRRMTLRSGFQGPADGYAAHHRYDALAGHHPRVRGLRPAGLPEPAPCRSGRSRLPGRLPVPDHAVFVDLPNLCRFRCLRCGGRKVTVMADWPDAGNGAEERERLRNDPRMR